VANWIFAQTTHVIHQNIIWRGGWSSSSSYNFQVSSTSAEQLPNCEGSKFGSSHYLGQWLIQQAVIKEIVPNETYKQTECRTE